MVAIPLGVYQVVRRNKPEDYIITGVTFILYAMPAFFLGTLLILWFGIYIKIFPTEAPQSTSVVGILADPRALVLPVLTLSAITIASFSRYMRSSMMETMTEDFVRTARAKGAGPQRVLYVHALRNAIIPIVTLLGLSLGTIVSGAVITESVFNYPGMGLLAVNSAFREDLPTLLGVTFVVTIAHHRRQPPGRHSLRSRRSEDPVCKILRTWSVPRKRSRTAGRSSGETGPLEDLDALSKELGERPRRRGRRQSRRTRTAHPLGVLREQARGGRRDRDHLLPALLLRGAALLPHQPDQRLAGALRPRQRARPATGTRSAPTAAASTSSGG